MPEPRKAAGFHYAVDRQVFLHREWNQQSSASRWEMFIFYQMNGFLIASRNAGMVSFFNVHLGLLVLDPWLLFCHRHLHEKPLID
ncbi:hypothetical protein OUZ56_030446 [Daphnia magna]|uniref:Uncharacterized protein n=1 Tax=Daphnia magna TaxID=35525 RepID=A0ABQ9ZRA8_9CRUS|nr:hypothetical protein OUZ56_030446 [Daphnia magna]